MRPACIQKDRKIAASLRRQESLPDGSAVASFGQEGVPTRAMMSIT